MAHPFGLKTSCSWIIVAIQWNKYDKLTFNLDHLKGAGQVTKTVTKLVPEIGMVEMQEYIYLKNSMITVKWKGWWWRRGGFPYPISSWTPNYGFKVLELLVSFS